MSLLAVGRAALPQPESAPAIPSAQQDLASGKTLFSERCEICHFSESRAQKIGPGLKGLYPRGKFADGKKVDDAAVTRWIESGGKNMPGFKGILKPDEIRDLLTYLRTL